MTPIIRVAIESDFDGILDLQSRNLYSQLTFINKLNQRSFAAHTRKLNIEIIDEFELNGNSFYTLAFLTTT
jgi:hypothetical protein